MIKDWKKEIARDIIALGSIPFYFIVIIRAIIGKYAPFVYQLLFALIILLILYQFIRFNQYIARGLILVVFTSAFYNIMLYTIFTALLWICMILSLVYLKVKGSEIIKGALLGLISTGISYYLTTLFIA